MSRQLPSQPEVLPGMEPLVPPQPEPWQVAEDVYKLVTLATATKPNKRVDITESRMAAGRLFGLTATKQVIESEHGFRDISNKMLELAEPSAIYSSVVGREVIDRQGKYGKQTTWYQNNKGKWHKVALSAREKSLLPGDIVAYANSASISTKKGKKQTLMPNPDPKAPTRAVVHLLDEKLPRLQTYADKTLRSNIETCTKLIEALHPKHVGLARLGSEFNMVSAKTSLLTMVEDLVDAYADQKGLDTERAGRVRQAILFNLFVDRKGNQHLAYARKLSTVLKGYNSAKLQAFEYAISKGEKHRQDHSL